MTNELPVRETATTSIATSTAEDVFIRGKSLTKELIGKVSFTEMAFFQITGAMPSAAQTAVLDACLVTLMEHGLTPSAIAARLVCSSAPEALQGAVAAGILAVGSVFVGSVEGAAAVLARIAHAPDIGVEARAVAAEHRSRRQPLPGFGHPQHKPDDPRTPVLLAIAEAHGLAGLHVAALQALSAEVDAARGTHLTINATGAIAAVLADAGIPTAILRGLAIVARCAGLVGHLLEEQERPTIGAVTSAVARAVPYAER